ncbi:small integral membrane protein 13-like [Hydractinia symbiolongicarpus]|uniref:small integral membrane protein 13-like n=1 Tax=Hydractinia symbiolongicarpus TaxID=13093 RepID=UPI00254F420B|nr:small integral membrane protein 13-like [Hydractinia symbiolongicarpus]
MDEIKAYFTDERINAVKDTILAFSGLVFGIIVVILLVVLGWFVVWRMFLLRFPFIKELVYGNDDEGKKKTKSQPLRRSVRLKEKQSHHTD